MEHSSAQQHPVDRLANEFVARYRRGERPTPSEYAQRHPEWADRILELFPTLLVMERLKPCPVGRDGPLDRPVDAVGPLGRLGDFLILREIGRGGMGIVYEAIQKSLGRHVALKVLPRDRMEPKLLERFRLEARSAARLHHTNIVPVFSVDEQDNTHYFAMQFIHGQSLDKVLKDVRRLHRDPAAPEPTGESSPTEILARNLLTGQCFVLVATPEVENLGGSILGSTLSAARTPGPHGPPTAAAAPVRSQRYEQSSLSGLPESQYIRSVARVGLQVAEALAYAHQQGVLHRDIKPSNLLLDMQGIVWVTDFGLAKMEGADGPTDPHDVVGTLRYMAPERFRGWSDPRSDIYGLGATLYELLTLQPAFDAEDRPLLVAAVLHDEPTRPRQLVGTIPHDLETIVLKAMAKEPNARYATAAALAEDLRLFLDGRPILARRTSRAERTWRWCQRNRAVATLLSVVAILLTTLAIGSTIVAIRRDRLLQEAESLRNWAEVSEREKTEQLRESLLEQARGSRLGGQAGQRFGSLEILAQASRIRSGSDLIDQAIAALALVDMRAVRQLGRQLAAPLGKDFDPTLERYAIGNHYGEIQICRVIDEQVIVRIPGFGVQCVGLQFSPNGRWLAARYGGEEALVVVWDTDNGRRAATLQVLDAQARVAFSHDSQKIAAGLPDGSIGLYHAATGREVRRIRGGLRPTQLAFHPDGRQVAATSLLSHAVKVFDVQLGAELWSTTLSAPSVAVAWSRDGRLLAVGGVDRGIYIWDAGTKELVSVLDGHQHIVSELAFTRLDNFLISSSWDGTTRVWDPIEGVSLVIASGSLVRLGENNRTLAMVSPEDRLMIWELAAASECRVLHHGNVGNRMRRPSAFGPVGLDFSPDGQMLVSAGADGVRLFDISSGHELVDLSLGYSGTARFRPDGAALLTFGLAGLRLWPITYEADQGMKRIVLGVPQFVDLPGGDQDAQAAWLHSGRFLAANDRSDERVVIFDAIEGTRRNAIGPHPNLRNVAVSPDGRWIATAGRFGSGVMVWDAESGRSVWETTGDDALVAFSPEGSWLAISDDFRCQLWRVGSWQPGPSFASMKRRSRMAFSHDGQILALEVSGGRIQLFEVKTGKAVSTLTSAPSYDTHAVTAIAFTPDGKRLAVSNGDHVIVVWDLRLIRAELTQQGFVGEHRFGNRTQSEGQELADSPQLSAALARSGCEQIPTPGPLHMLLGQDLGEVWRVAYSTDGGLVAASAEDGSVTIWDARTGAFQVALKGHTARAHLAIAPAGEHLITVSRDGTMKRWDLASRQVEWTTEGPRQVNALTLSPDGRVIATCGGRSTGPGELDLWNSATGTHLKRLAGHPDRIFGVAFAPDGNRLASASFDRTIRVWDVASGEMLALLEGHLLGVETVSFTPTGEALVAGSWDGRVSLWDTSNWNKLVTLQGHGDIRSLAVSSDGQTLAVGTHAGIIVLWNLKTFTMTGEFKAHNHGIWSLAFSPDGCTLASCGRDGAVKLWKLSLCGRDGAVKLWKLSL